MSEGVTQYGVEVESGRRILYADGNYASYMDSLGRKDVSVMVRGRGGSWVKARSYQLSSRRLEGHLGEWRRTGVFRSPYTKSLLTDLLNALSGLGVNRAHPVVLVWGRMKAIMSVDHSDPAVSRVRDGVSDWDRFVGRGECREGGRDQYGRLLWAAASLRRVDPRTSKWPTGLKLAQLGCALEVFRVGPSRRAVNCVYMRLNTHSVVPVNRLLGDESEIPEVDFSASTLGPSVHKKLKMPYLGVWSDV